MPSENLILVAVDLYSGDPSTLDQLGSRFESINLSSSMEYPTGSGYEHTFPKNVFVALMTAENPAEALTLIRSQVEKILDQMRIGSTDCKIIYLTASNFSMSIGKD
jgi:hypothetical protein